MNIGHNIKERLLSKEFVIPSVLSMLTIAYVVLNIAYFKTGTAAGSLTAALISLSVCLLAFFAGILAHLHRVERQQRLEQELQEAKLEQVEKLLAVMEEERNDILNAISVVTVYLQLGKYEQAQKYLEFIAAEQIDKIDYHKKTWLDDPWEAILGHKRQEALEYGILFTIEQKTAPPEDSSRRRLIARLMANLVEEAFQGVRDLQNRRVWLRWYLDEGKPVLEVKSSCPARDGGYNILEPEGANWRLPICQQIASEVGGMLSVNHSGQSTTFRFELQ